MITCKQVAEALSSGDVERRGVWERWRVRVHLWMCDSCSRFARQLRDIRQAGRRLRSAYDKEQRSGAGDSLEERILTKLEALPSEGETKQ